ncbi:MAG: ATP-NAD kinase [Gammaproteobacteria bacterium]|nr:ATP-NAD kinase [Gammaproteobacteria bacterium]
MKIGLVINPQSGVGGSVALKGSDGAELQELAKRRDGEPRGVKRAQAFLERLFLRIDDLNKELSWKTWGDEMGEIVLKSHQVVFEVLGRSESPTVGADTSEACSVISRAGVDILIFVGGDGTARDVLEGVCPGTLVLGIPSGVKMHSGVFAITPDAAADLIRDLLFGEPIRKVEKEVRDYDSQKSDENQSVITKCFGEMWVPDSTSHVQQTKVPGSQDEALLTEEIIAYIFDNISQHREKAIVIGPGRTCLLLKERLGVAGTLLGFDVMLQDEQWLLDVPFSVLKELQNKGAIHIFLSFSRAQGFLLGRGNQQLSAEVLSELSWADDFTFLGTLPKLKSLEGRPLRVDTGSRDLDRSFEGLVEISCGYDERVVYQVSAV